jgi:hypothetical protein
MKYILWLCKSCIIYLHFFFVAVLVRYILANNFCRNVNNIFAKAEVKRGGNLPLSYCKDDIKLHSACHPIARSVPPHLLAAFVVPSFTVGGHCIISLLKQILKSYLSTLSRSKKKEETLKERDL